LLVERRRELARALPVDRRERELRDLLLRDALLRREALLRRLEAFRERLCGARSSCCSSSILLSRLMSSAMDSPFAFHTEME
jgi:hypothetical protein